jgi:undecaprenyl-diphosphatase
MELILKAIVMGIVEGFTEFIPISSTGHLILVNHFLPLPAEFAVLFNVFIQLGAILSVVIYFRKELVPWTPHKSDEERKQVWETWKKTIIGVLPALVIGAALGEFVEKILFVPEVVAAALFLGGIFLVLIERRKNSDRVQSLAELTYRTAFIIGMIQCLAMIPGISRSAATIIGAMLLGCSRTIAAEYSFFLAIPTMVAASTYQLAKNFDHISAGEWRVLFVGFVVSFLAAWAAIAFLMNYIRKNDFTFFGYYRIVLGIIVIAYFTFAVTQ